MSFPTQLDIALGKANGWSVVHKFGHNDAIPLTYEPVSEGGIYRTPQVSGATKLRIAAGDVGDTADGIGAREVVIQGLDATGAEVIETLATNGTSPSAETVNNYIRLYRSYVSLSGTYASQSAGSHVAPIVIENAAGTEIWATLPVESFPHSQSQIGAYTVPLGKTAFVTKLRIQAETNKVVDALFFSRQGILETAPPYEAMRGIEEFLNIQDLLVKKFDEPLVFPELTDIGFMAKVVSQTARVAVDIDILLRQN